jgi:DNA polymerase III subunit delta'
LLFSEVIGQVRLKSQIRQLLDSGKVPHALLLTSPKGGGGLPMGLALAHALMCEAPVSDGACLRCSACIKTQKHIHPDLHFSFPTVGSKVTSDTFLKDWRLFLSQTPYQDAFAWLQKIGAENKQGNINVDETQSITKKLSLQVLEGKYKILLLWMPEYLGKEGNRLLKLIEEPPDKTVFILVAEQTDQILQTILSRCQLLKLGPLSVEEITDVLINKHGAPKLQAQNLAFLADGNYSEALELMETEVSTEGVAFTDWLRACWQGSPVAIMPQVETFHGLGRENQKQFLRYGLQFFRELIVALVAGNSPLKLPADIAVVAQKFATLVTFDKCAEICQHLTDDLYHIERNANARVLFTALSIEVHQILIKKH